MLALVTDPVLLSMIIHVLGFINRHQRFPVEMNLDSRLLLGVETERKLIETRSYGNHTSLALLP
jgi:hypothetical protein